MMTTVQDSPSPTPTTIQQDQVETTVEGDVVSRREASRRVQVDHHPSINIATSMNVRHSQGSGMFVTLLIRLLLLPSSGKTLDTHSLILIG
jgi:hypothetical protein